MADHIPPPPPPPGQWQGQLHAPPGQQWQQPAAWQQHGYYQPAPAQLGAGLHVTSIVTGIFGVICGLIPLFFLGARAFGSSALVVGVIAYRKAKAVGQRQGRAGMILGAIALVLGTIGFAIVADAFDTLDDDLSCIEEADTPQELDECNEGGS